MRDTFLRFELNVRESFVAGLVGGRWHRHFLSRGHAKSGPHSPPVTPSVMRRPMRYSCGRGDEKWLVILNCHCLGFANCLCLLAENVQIDAYMTREFSKRIDDLRDSVDNYQRIFVVPPYLSEPAISDLDLAGRENVTLVPTVYFDGYHPDSCLAYDEGKVVTCDAGLHSLICFTAYHAGFNESQTAALYNNSIFERLGYYERWERARDLLFKRFSDHEYDIREAFLRWTRTGPFMHTPNHPQIHCLRDVAGMILERLGITPAAWPVLPHDNLAKGPIWPVYPELAVRLGVPGSYRFKLGGSYESDNLAEFIARNFALYRARAPLTLSPASQSVANALREIL